MMNLSELHIREKVLRKSIPVFINSFNQLHYLSELVQFLLDNGFGNIYVMDNQSQYPPLLDWFREVIVSSARRVSIIRYEDNHGPHFFHRSELFKSIWNYPHFYTDPDIIFTELSPVFVSYFLTVSEKLKVAKVASALSLPEVPDMMETQIRMPETNQMPVSIREWEARFWVEKISENIYLAPVDTTFHLFNPAHYVPEGYYQGVRIAGKGFEARHRPWFKSDQSPLEERIFYKNSSIGYGGWLSSKQS